MQASTVTAQRSHLTVNLGECRVACRGAHVRKQFRGAQHMGIHSPEGPKRSVLIVRGS